MHRIHCCGRAHAGERTQCDGAVLLSAWGLRSSEMTLVSSKNIQDKSTERGVMTARSVSKSISGVSGMTSNSIMLAPIPVSFWWPGWLASETDLPKFFSQ